MWLEMGQRTRFSTKQHLLPEWVGVASSLGEVPFGAIVIVDEAHFLYHARGSTTQESRSIDKNIASSVNVII
jgi:hypothetical protein